jgi:hypothetical protein
MGHKFALVLSRAITEEESATLRTQESGVVFGTDSLSTDAELTVTRMDFDDTVSPTLEEAIESALEMVKAVPELSVQSLTVPAILQETEGESPQETKGEQQSETQPGVADGEVIPATDPPTGSINGKEPMPV